MDVNKYITSGILEAYVLGGLSKQERQEVECMSSIYEEIEQELRTLQSAFEKTASDNATPPPPELKDSIMNVIANTPQDHTMESNESKSAPIVPLNPQREKQSQIWRVASVILLFVSIGAASLYFMNRSEVNQQADRIAALDKKNLTQAENLKENRIKLLEIAELNDFITNKETQQVLMPGTKIDPDAATRVYYNDSENQVALQVDFLPETPSDKQYQLWAIVDGQPTDMGVLETIENGETFFVEYAAGEPQAFAITLEKAGGSDQPDLDNLYVIGEV